jgi:hypothetical protein
MWLEVFKQNYSKAAERYYACRLEPSEVERELAGIGEGPVRIVSVIDTLERSTFWDYPKWWPRLSEELRGATIEIPENLSKEASRTEVITSLHDRIKNIECVSIILRFLRPEWFGIISFPVTNLISLRRARHATDYYRRYLASLQKLRRHYAVASLGRVADIDMALWSAALFSQDPDLGPEFEAIKKATEEMWQDEKFQELRIRNLLSGLQLKEEGSMYLVFARALLEHDYRLASVITAKVYESLISEIGQTWGLPPADGKERQTRSLVADIEGRGIPTRIGIGRGKLLEWLRLRNRAVHETPEPLTRSEAQRFAGGVGDLLVALHKV